MTEPLLEQRFYSPPPEEAKVPPAPVWEPGSSLEGGGGFPGVPELKLNTSRNSVKHSGAAVVVVQGRLL